MTPLQQLHPRTPWQALDYGLHLCNRNWAALWRFWLLPFGLVFALLWWITPASEQLWLVMVLWWLKPVYDRLLLWVFSRQMQSQGVRWRDLRLQWPDLFRTGLFSALLIPLPMAGARFDFSRSFHLPIIQLEGISPRRQDDRFHQLGLTHRRFARLLTIAWVHAEFLLFAVLLMGLMMLSPSQSFNESDFWWQQWMDYAHLETPLYLLALLAMEPFYVAAGFSLYLHRRVELEAWDLELKFREIARHLRASVPLLVLLLLPLGLLPIDTLEAQNQQEIREQVQRITEGERFQEYETVYHWKWNFADREEEDEPFDGSWLQWLKYLPAALRVLFWLLVLAGILFLLWRYRQWLRMQWQALGQRSGAQRSLAAAPVQHKDAPLTASLQSLWQQGEQQTVLRLLFERIRQYYGYSPTMTEQQFLQQQNEDTCSREIAQLRQQVQYAGKPAAETFLRDWQQRCEDRHEA